LKATDRIWYAIVFYYTEERSEATSRRLLIILNSIVIYFERITQFVFQVVAVKIQSCSACYLVLLVLKASRVNASNSLATQTLVEVIELEHEQIYDKIASNKYGISKILVVELLHSFGRRRDVKASIRLTGF
jgi:hypothetical protein